MADDGMDPCECIWSHEFAMRRLLSLLRQTQAVCTDTECFDEMPRLPGQQSSPQDNVLLMMVAWLVIALVMFMMRPNSLRNNNKNDADFRNNEGDGGRPPTPPAVN